MQEEVRCKFSDTWKAQEGSSWALPEGIGKDTSRLKGLPRQQACGVAAQRGVGKESRGGMVLI